MKQGRLDCDELPSSREDGIAVPGVRVSNGGDLLPTLAEVSRSIGPEIRPVSPVRLDSLSVFQLSASTCTPGCRI
jgi:hypothetical protein